MDYFYLNRNPEQRVTMSMQETRDAIKELDVNGNDNKGWKCMQRFISDEHSRERRLRVYKMLWKRTMNEGVAELNESKSKKKTKKKKDKN